MSMFSTEFTLNNTNKSLSNANNSQIISQFKNVSETESFENSCTQYNNVTHTKNSTSSVKCEKTVRQIELESIENENERLQN